MPIMYQTEFIDDELLPEEVTKAYLPEYDQAQLEARKLHYQREALFERNEALREALLGEVERTEIELNRRKMYEREEAERVFAL